jgi:hypothetical protein
MNSNVFKSANLQGYLYSHVLHQSFLEDFYKFKQLFLSRMKDLRIPKPIAQGMLKNQNRLYEGGYMNLEDWLK